MVSTLKNSKKWIFLRGLGRHSGHWGHFVDDFKQAFPDDEVEFLDLRGNGSLSHSPSWVSIEDNVRDLRQRSLFLSQGEPVYLMSISLGAMVATEWAHRHPDEIEGLVLINTSDRGTSSFFERLRLKNIYHALPLFLKNKTGIEFEKKILEMTTTNPELQHWAQVFSKMSTTSKQNLIRQLIAASRYYFPDHKPKTEVLILCGEQDQLVNPICSKRLAKMWTLTPHCHPQGGHDIPLQDPKWVCDQVRLWLEA